MLVTLRVPISDARGFSADPAISESIVLPQAWAEGDFLRGVGQITRRPGGIVEPWSFEAAFANGRHLVTIPPETVVSFSHERERVVERVRKRAWQALEGSTALLDLDVAFQITPIRSLGRLSYWSYGISGSEVGGDVGALAGLLVRIRADEPGRTRRFITTGPLLAARYAAATSAVESSRRLVGPGRITAVVEAPGVAVESDHPNRFATLELGRISLTSMDLPVVGGGTIRTHILHSASRSTGDRKRIRELRIHILRLHSIFELMRFLNSPAVSGAKAGIADARGTNAFNRLQETLLACVRTVRPNTTPGRADPDKIVDTAFFARRLVDLDLQNMLKRTLAVARPKVRAEVEALLEHERVRDAVLSGKIKGEINMGDTYNVGNAGVVGANATVNGPVVVGENNTITIGGQHFGAGELAAQLRTLAARVSDEAGTDGAPDDAADAPAQLEEAAVKAESGDSSGVLAILKKVGNWVLGVASQIAVPVAIGAIKAATGMV